MTLTPMAELSPAEPYEPPIEVQRIPDESRRQLEAQLRAQGRTAAQIFDAVESDVARRAYALGATARQRQDAEIASKRAEMHAHRVNKLKPGAERDAAFSAEVEAVMCHEHILKVPHA